MPALPLDEAGPYVAAAYLAFLFLVLVYVAIMAARVERVRRELAELADRVVARRERDAGQAAGSVEADPGGRRERAEGGSERLRQEQGSGQEVR